MDRLEVTKEELENPLLYIPKFFKVLTKPDARGMSHLVPMNLLRSQKYYIANRSHRDVILKNRQTGMSTGVMASNAHPLFTEHYQRQALITHDQETSGFLFQTIERFYNNLPDDMKPQRDWASGERMKFPKLDSYIYIDSAQSSSMAIGHTLARVHMSEIARWNPKTANQLFADVSQAVSAGGFVTLESTPRGKGGLFYNTYSAAKSGAIPYKWFFFPWWWDESCVRPTYRSPHQLAEQAEQVSARIGMTV